MTHRQKSTGVEREGNEKHQKCHPLSLETRTRSRKIYFSSFLSFTRSNWNKEAVWKQKKIFQSDPIVRNFNSMASNSERKQTFFLASPENWRVGKYVRTRWARKAYRVSGVGIDKVAPDDLRGPAQLSRGV